MRNAGQESIYEDDEDRRRFLDLLGQVAAVWNWSGNARRESITGDEAAQRLNVDDRSQVSRRQELRGGDGFETEDSTPNRTPLATTFIGLSSRLNLRILRTCLSESIIIEESVGRSRRGDLTSELWILSAWFTSG
jgi:hypothetical protein